MFLVSHNHHQRFCFVVVVFRVVVILSKFKFLPKQGRNTSLQHEIHHTIAIKYHLMTRVNVYHRSSKFITAYDDRTLQPTSKSQGIEPQICCGLDLKNAKGITRVGVLVDCAWIKIEITCAQSQGGVLVTVSCVYLYVPCSLISNYWNSIHPSSCVEIKFERHFDSADKRHIFQSYNDLTIFQVVQDFFRLFVALLRRTGCWDCPALTGFVDFLDSFVDPILCKFISLVDIILYVSLSLTTPPSRTPPMSLRVNSRKLILPKFTHHMNKRTTPGLHHRPRQITNGRLIQQIANSEDWAPRTGLRERAKY